MDKLVSSCVDITAYCCFMQAFYYHSHGDIISVQYHLLFHYLLFFNILKHKTAIGFFNGVFNALLFSTTTSLFDRDAAKEAWSFCQVPPGIAIIIGPGIAGGKTRSFSPIGGGRDGVMVYLIEWKYTDILTNNIINLAPCLTFLGTSGYVCALLHVFSKPYQFQTFHAVWE